MAAGSYPFDGNVSDNRYCSNSIKCFKELHTGLTKLPFSSNYFLCIISEVISALSKSLGYEFRVQFID